MKDAPVLDPGLLIGGQQNRKEQIQQKGESLINYIRQKTQKYYQRQINCLNHFIYLYPTRIYLTVVQKYKIISFAILKMTCIAHFAELNRLY
jgi:hypothetical protein